MFTIFHYVFYFLWYFRLHVLVSFEVTNKHLKTFIKQKQSFFLKKIEAIVLLSRYFLKNAPIFKKLCQKHKLELAYVCVCVCVCVFVCVFISF